MGVGRFIVEQHRIPSHTDISFKQVENPLEWITHSWISDVIIYLSNLLHPYGPAMMLILVLLFSLVMLYHLLKMTSENNTGNVLIIAAISLLAGTFWKLHPLVLSLPLLLAVISSYFSWKKGDHKVIRNTPFLLLIFANMAGGYVLIPVSILLAFMISEGVLSLRVGWHKAPITKNSSIQSLYGWFSLAIIATLLNPLGHKIYVYAWTGWWYFFQRNLLSNLADTLYATNTSYFRDAPSPFLYTLFLGYLLIILFGLFVSLNRIRHSLRTSLPVLALLPFVMMGYFWIRLIPFSVFITAPVFAWLVSYYSGLPTVLKMRMYLLIPIFMVGTVCSAGVFLFPPQIISFTPPTKQAEFIRTSHLSGNVLSPASLSGYMFYSLYPHKGYIDMQDDLYDENELIGMFSPATSLPTDYIEKILEQNNIRVVIASKDDEYLINTMYLLKGWALVYFESNGLVFVSTSRVSKDYVKQNALRYIDPTRPLGTAPEHISMAIEELESYNKRLPDSTLAHGQLSSLYRYTRQLDKAEETLLAIPIESWDYTVMTEMGRLKAAQGKCKESEGWYRRVLAERTEQYYSRAVLDLAVLYAGCLNDKPQAEHYFMRYNSFALPPYERERVKKIAIDFGILLEDENIQGTKK